MYADHDDVIRWVKKKAKTHRQEKCPKCGLYLWVKRTEKQ